MTSQETPAAYTRTRLPLANSARADYTYHSRNRLPAPSEENSDSLCLRGYDIWTSHCAAQPTRFRTEVPKQRNGKSEGCAHDGATYGT
jgi:hypothetical protein